MVGETSWFHRKVIQREFSSVLVLNRLGANKGAHAPPRKIVSLDNAFDLIEGHPSHVWDASVTCHPPRKIAGSGANLSPAGSSLLLWMKAAQVGNLP